MLYHEARNIQVASEVGALLLLSLPETDISHPIAADKGLSLRLPIVNYTSNTALISNLSAVRGLPEEARSRIRPVDGGGDGQIV